MDEITRSLLSLPTNILLLLLAVVFGGLSVLVTFTVRKIIQRKKLGSFNDVIGFNFTVASGFYALLLAFVVADAMSDLDDIQENADREQCLAKNFYHQIRSYPDKSKIADLRREYVRYIELVIKDEFPKMEGGKESEQTKQAFAKVFRLVEELKPKGRFSEVRAQFLLESLNDLGIYRSLRLLDSKSDIPDPMWLALLVGGLIISVFAALLIIENFRYYLIISGLMGAFVGLMFFLIIILDHPFTGSIKIEPTGYETVLEMTKIE